MEPKPRKVEYYQTKAGKAPFREWLDKLNDRVGKARIDARVTRLQAGQFGKCKSVGNGVYELKDKFGPGYRIYYAEDGQEVILLLCGGDKSDQQADIQVAKNYWTDHQLRKQERMKEHGKKEGKLC